MGHPTYANAVPKVVVATGEDKLAVLERVIEAGGLWEGLIAAAQQAGAEAADLAVLIKPDLALFDRAAPTFTDPELVEHLIDQLHDHGYTRVVVAAGQDDASLWLENREPLVLADLAGYRFVTEVGRSYDVLDLGEDLVATAAPPGSAIHGRQLARAWVEAGYRIGFAKSKTDEAELYSLGVRNVYDVLPLAAAERKGLRFAAPDVCSELLRATPLHFAIIDAFVSNHGDAGSREAHPLPTHTLFASTDPLLCDWAAALKMGVDPYGSPTAARALHVIGLPEPHAIEGDLTPYQGWIPVDPWLAEATRRRNASPGLARACEPWLQSVDRSVFPFKSPLDDRLNTLLRRALREPNPGSAALAFTIAFNVLLGTAYEGATAAAVLFAKDRLRWQDRPLGLDLSQYTAADYEAVVSYMEPLEALVRTLPASGSGLRWRYLERSVLFEFSRELPLPFAAFVERVDVSRSIRFMNDYIGGDCVPVCRDERGRVVHQAERNLYLAQPNYLVLSGGQCIDVTKIERISYGDDEQKISWRTVKSENRSALHDDGSVSFARLGEHATLVTVTGRQEFVLPFFWQAVDLDLYPAIKDALVVHAYTGFFHRTLANFEAAYEGREFRVGRPPEAETGKRAAERALDILGRLAGRLTATRGLRQAFASVPRPRAHGHLDDDGFLHFAGGASAPGTAGRGAWAATKEARSEEVETGSREMTGAPAAEAAAASSAWRLRETFIGTVAFLLDLAESMRRDADGFPTDEEGR